MNKYSPFQNRFTCEGYMRFSLVLIVFILCLLMFACSSSSTTDDNPTDTGTPTDTGSNGTDEPVDIPQIIWSYDPDLKNPVTDLADCIQSVLDCIGKGTELKDCFDSDVQICTGDEPTDFCCTQACADQITQTLESGASQHEAIVEVFVYDGSCMPDIPEANY